MIDIQLKPEDRSLPDYLTIRDGNRGVVRFDFNAAQELSDALTFLSGQAQRPDDRPRVDPARA
jgi:hypothetical protein